MIKEGQRSIFRIEAVRRNSRGGREAILPQFNSPRIIWLLWTLIGLALAGGLLLWLMRIPIYTTAIAIPLPNGSHEPLMAVLVPARDANKVRVGQRVFWSFTKTGQRVNSTVIEVKQEARSPDSLQGELNLRGQAAISITEPVVIALVNLGPVPDNLPASAYAGSVYRAEVEVGTRRVISLLPVFGRFIGN